MDPQATWAEILRALAESDPDSCAEACQHLRNWIEKGGFPPAITGIAEIDSVMAQAVCIHILKRTFPERRKQP